MKEKSLSNVTIVALLGLIATLIAIMTPIIKLNTTITELNTTLHNTNVLVEKTSRKVEDHEARIIRLEEHELFNNKTRQGGEANAEH